MSIDGVMVSQIIRCLNDVKTMLKFDDVTYPSKNSELISIFAITCDHLYCPLPSCKNQNFFEQFEKMFKKSVF